MHTPSCAVGDTCCYVGTQISGGYKTEDYTCADTKTSTTNCGRCGKACDFGDVCCNGLCVNTLSANYHCAQCGCTNGMTCQNGTSQCPSGEITCCGYCTNTNTDPSSCGSCGNICPDLGNTICQKGTCQCMVSGDIICNGSCTGPYWDSSNCGSCGNVCPPTCCAFGACAATNFQTDPNNCGSCGNTRASFNCCSKGQCANVLTDVNNCGTCGNVCPAGSSCCLGTCANYLTDSNNCGGCDNVCGPGFTCCNGDCVFLYEDADNCGKCGHACDNNCCSAGRCANFSNDSNNCGTCRNVCYPPYGNCFNGCCVNNASSPLTSVKTSNSPNPCATSDATNYWLSNQYCENITGLNVTLSLQQNLYSSNGFSLQLNAVPPPNNQHVTWMQYAFIVTDSEVDAWVEYWNWQLSGYCTMFSNNDVDNCCSNGNCCGWFDSWWDEQFGGICNNSFFLTSQSSTVEAGLDRGQSLPRACPLAANFPGYGYTGESSNAVYGPMSPCCGSSLSQFLE